MERRLKKLEATSSRRCEPVIDWHFGSVLQCQVYEAKTSKY